MNALKVLGGRGLREALRTPDALLPTLLIPLFFLVVNIGQAGRIDGITPAALTLLVAYVRRSSKGRPAA